MLRLEVVQQDKVGRIECAICLLPCDLEPVMVAVRGGESEDVHLGGSPYVCRRCVYGGVEHMIRELRNRAESARRAAEQLDRWADEGIEIPGELQKIIGSKEPLAWLFEGIPPKTN
jgi:hypothetical protein